MSDKMGFPAQVRYWKDAIARFLRENPQYVGDNTGGYFRFLASRRIVSEEVADKACLYAATKNFCGPEAYVRARRELEAKGVVRVSPQKRQMLLAQERETRDYYGQDRDNAAYQS